MQQFQQCICHHKKLAKEQDFPALRVCVHKNKSSGVLFSRMDGNFALGFQEECCQHVFIQIWLLKYSAWRGNAVSLDLLRLTIGFSGISYCFMLIDTEF